MKRNSSFAQILRKKYAQPICWLDDSTLVYYWRGKFVSIDVESKSEKLIGNIKLNAKEKLLSFFSISRRLFRLYIFSPTFDYRKQEILFSFNGYFCSYNLKTNVFLREQLLDHGARRLLSICFCKNGDVYYGEYPTKNDGTDVCIIRRNTNKEHSIVYRFEPGSIRHIHYVCEYGNDLFCFTGDENNETNIFQFKNKNFKTQPDCLLSGSQDCRACVAMFNNGYLYYLTDNPYFENGLFAFDLKKSFLKQMFRIEGSVIYGLVSNNFLFFSTCVEYNLSKKKNNKNVILKINGKIGGIRSNESILYCFNCNANQLIRLIKIKKDCLSIKYFGIGTFMFTCNNSSKYLAVFSQSLKINETLFIFDIQEANL
ncbi:MAG TPA: hypothetical protein DDW20_01275 [Firmicutes bacterium]|nr:hypothetical protein [Bacillota bacterium]